MLHIADFIDVRIVSAFPKDNGKQTPFGSYPAFVA